MAVGGGGATRVFLASGTAFEPLGPALDGEAFGAARVEGQQGIGRGGLPDLGDEVGVLRALIAVAAMSTLAWLVVPAAKELPAS